MNHCPGFEGAHGENGADLPDDSFYLDKRRKGVGLSYLCKECHKAAGKVRAKRWYAANSERQIAAVLERRKAGKQ